MGGFTNGTYPPAEEPPPENAFDVQSFTTQILDTLREQGFAPKVDAEGHVTEPSAGSSEQASLFFRILGHLVKDSPDILQKMLEGVGGMATPFLKSLVTIVTGLLAPGMNVLGELTHEYVTQVAGRGLEKSPGGLPVPGGPAKDATGFVFDQIMAPLLNVLTPSSPGRVGAGEENAQHILGTIISLHLSTWMVNILSNMTGLGFLKWINSFDDAITSGISARGFSRMATRPYLDKFVVTPAARDLNMRYPLEFGSVAALLKRYLRGKESPEAVKAMLRGKGYDDSTVEDLLLEAAKLFSVDDLAYLMDAGNYTLDDSVQALVQQGYPESVARGKLGKHYWDLVDSQLRLLAGELVTACVDRRLDTDTLRYLLGKMGFSQEEVNAWVVHAATLQEINIRLTLAQVKDLYNEGIEDLNFVQGWLDSEGYSMEDRDRLVLLYFTKKEERDAVKARQADARRNAAAAQAKKDQATIAAQQTQMLLLG